LFGVLLCVLGEGLLLRLIPVLVESSLEFIGEMLCPDSGKGSEAAGSLNVTDKTDNDHLKPSAL
jgi:hypothetical protein